VYGPTPLLALTVAVPLHATVHDAAVVTIELIVTRGLLFIIVIAD